MNQLLTSKNAVKYLLNNFPEIEFRIFEGLSKGLLRVKEICGQSRNVVIFVYPDSTKVEYFVLKQVQRNDESKRNSLKNEALFFENNVITGRQFCFFDNENFILCYENLWNFQTVYYDEFENPNFGLNLFLSIQNFSSYFIGLLDSPSEIFVKCKKFNILEDWNKYKLLMQQSDDISIIESISFIDKYQSVFKEILKRWKSEQSKLCHGDVKIPNLLKKDDEYFLIDFEMVVLANPVFDISSFIYNTLYINWYINPIPTHSSLIQLAIKELLLAYSKNNNRDYDKVLSDSFLFFYVMLIENYINGTLKQVWVGEKQNIRYKRVLDFQKIILEYPKIDFIKSLI